MSWPGLELANTSIWVAPAAAREYDARATSTPPLVDSLPLSVNRSVSMQSSGGPAYAFGPVVVHGFGFDATGPPMPGPSIRTKLTPVVLPVTLCGVAASPM